MLVRHTIMLSRQKASCRTFNVSKSVSPSLPLPNGSQGRGEGRARWKPGSANTVDWPTLFEECSHIVL
jgi:hypothetical protein